LHDTFSSSVNRDRQCGETEFAIGFAARALSELQIKAATQIMVLPLFDSEVRKQGRRT